MTAVSIVSLSSHAHTFFTGITIYSSSLGMCKLKKKEIWYIVHMVQISVDAYSQLVKSSIIYASNHPYENISCHDIHDQPRDTTQSTSEDKPAN